MGRRLLREKWRRVLVLYQCVMPWQLRRSVPLEIRHLPACHFSKRLHLFLLVSKARYTFDRQGKLESTGMWVSRRSLATYKFVSNGTCSLLRLFNAQVYGRPSDLERKIIHVYVRKYLKTSMMLLLGRYWYLEVVVLFQQYCFNYLYGYWVAFILDKYNL